MFSRVLVPLDGSTLAIRVLAHVAALAQADAEVLLLRVIEPGSDSQIVDPLDWRLERDVASSYVEQVAAELREHTTLRPTTLVLEGNPAEKILEAARDTGTQLLALSSHGAGGLNAWNLNSVSFKVAQRAGISILVARSYRVSEMGPADHWVAERYRRILIPLDGSLRSEHVLPAAERLAKRQDATLVLAHVLIEPRPIQRMVDSATVELQQHALEEGAHLATRYLAELAAGMQAKAEEQVLLNHDPAAALHQFAEDHQIDLVILSAHGHSGQRSWPHGSLATSFVLHGGTPLLVLQDVAWEHLTPSKAELAALSNAAPPVHAGGVQTDEAERVQANGVA